MGNSIESHRAAIGLFNARKCPHKRFYVGSVSSECDLLNLRELSGRSCLEGDGIQGTLHLLNRNGITMLICKLLVALAYCLVILFEVVKLDSAIGPLI